MNSMKRRIANYNGKNYNDKNNRNNDRNFYAERFPGECSCVKVTDEEWFNKRWVDKYYFERDWFDKNWIDKYKLSKISKV